MRAEHRRDAPVEPRGERDLLARRLGVDVDENHGRRCTSLLHEVVDDLPHAARRLEVERSEDVDDRDRRAVAGLDDRRSAAGRCVVEVRGSDDR